MAVRVKEFFVLLVSAVSKEGGKTERFTLVHSLRVRFWSWLPCEQVQKVSKIRTKKLRCLEICILLDWITFLPSQLSKKLNGIQR